MSDLTKALVTRFGPPADAYGARWLPIPRPEYKDLPPSIQLRIARQQQAEEREGIARYEAQQREAAEG